eukprot:scaffold444_cov109-Cylindrotheca_fusiformis.AAC.9
MNVNKPTDQAPSHEGEDLEAESAPRKSPDDEDCDKQKVASRRFPILLVSILFFVIVISGVVIWGITDSHAVPSTTKGAGALAVAGSDTDSDPPLEMSTDFPLGLCQGDCDTSADCADGLTCHQRDAGEPVPGCTGGAEDDSNTDYCVPIRQPLEISTDFPLGLCQGDCDTNADCADGLTCYQRNARELVPGCTGGAEDDSKTDYCVPNRKPKLTMSTDFPLGLCQGDCDTSNDCANGLVCFQRDEGEEVPGCDGGREDGSRNDYCIPEDMASPLYLKQLGAPITGSPDDNLGSSVSVSNDGRVMAVGAIEAGSTGYVNIYELGDDETWKFATQIEGDEIGAQFGHSVSLSQDGSFLAVGIPKSNNETCRHVGKVRVFELDLEKTTNKWSMVGSDIVPVYNGLVCDYPREGFIFNEDGSGFGYAVSISGNGKIVAMSEELYAGIGVFELRNGQWELMPGAPVSGTSSTSISISNDGMRVAVVNLGNGYVLEFSNEINWWVALGQMFGGSDPNDSSTSNVQDIALSGDGRAAAVSGIDESTGLGFVEIYENPDNTTWRLRGTRIFGYAQNGDSVAAKIALSKDAQTIAVGDYRSDGVGNVRLYRFNSDEADWTQIGSDVRGQQQDGQFGKALALASDGAETTVLVVGAPQSSSSRGFPGSTFVYQTEFGFMPPPTIPPTASPTSAPEIAFEKMRGWKGSRGRVHGNAVSLSKDGRAFAFGVLQPGGEGYVESFVLGADNRWDRLERLKGDERNSRFGFSVSLSANGKVMAVGIPESDDEDERDKGRVRVFEFDEASSSWKALGSDIVGLPGNPNGVGESDIFGHSVSLSAAGDIVAVGAPYGDDHVSVFRLEGGQWTRLGSTINYNEVVTGLDGWSVALSNDGLVVATGAPWNERVSSLGWRSNDSGAARVYEFVNGEWRQRDGDTVAIGSINNDNANGIEAGYVRIYQYDADEGIWTPLGKPILGEAEGDHSGASVSLADDGRKIAIGSRDHGEFGQVRLFEFDSANTYWRQIGSGIDGEAEGSGFGASVSLVDSEGGMKLAVGAPDFVESTLLGLVHTLRGEAFVFEEIVEE